MIVSHTNDMERIIHVLSHPEIWERIHDGDDKPFSYEFEENTYYIMDEKNTGLVIIHWVNKATYEAHIHVLPDHRGKAVEFAEAVKRYIWENSKIMKLISFIPEIYPDVLGFAKKIGFEQEGFLSKSYLKNGKLVGQFVIGLSRPEVQNG